MGHTYTVEYLITVNSLDNAMLINGVGAIYIYH